MVLCCAARRAGPTSETCLPVAFVLHGQLRAVSLMAVAGPGDDGELALTVMRPEED